MQQQSHFMQNQTQHQTVHGYTHKKCETYNSTVRCVHVFFNKTTCMYHNLNISTSGNTHWKAGSCLQKAPRGCKQYSTVGKGDPTEWASFSFTTQTHTVWLPAHSTLDTTQLTIFSTWVIKQSLCQCSTISSNKASKNLQSHFHDRYALYSFPHFLLLSEQHHIIHLGVVCWKKKEDDFILHNQ